MFNIVICDDNKGYLSLFKGMAEEQFHSAVKNGLDFCIGASFDNGKALLEYAYTHRIDVLFLDIDMPDLSGFKIAKKLNEKSNGGILIVFMSAYDNFVYESFDYFPFAYIRKNNVSNDLPKVVSRIVENLSAKMRYITLPCGKQEVKVNLSEIAYFESKKNYYEAHLTNGEIYSCRGTLTQLESDIGAFDFFRIHNAYIVNLENVGRVIGNRYVTVNGVTLPIAQKRSKGFKEAFLEFTRRNIGI